jgi:hypothetical protein
LAESLEGDGRLDRAQGIVRAQYGLVMRATTEAQRRALHGIEWPELPALGGVA